MADYSLDKWQDLTSAWYNQIKIKSDPNDFHARFNYNIAGQLVTTNVQFTSQVFRRDPLAIKNFDHEVLLFEQYHNGTNRGTLGDVATEIDPNRIHLIDMGRTYIASTTNVVAEGVLIPYRSVGYDPSRDPSYVSLPVNSNKARLLIAAFVALKAAVQGARPRETEELSDIFATLVRKLMLVQKCDTDQLCSKGTIDLALRDYIESQLESASLDTQHLCARFRLSRATLYRRFAEEGGVERYILGRRLDRCFSELWGTPAVKGRIKIVAQRWGYSDPGNFNRRFKERFGLTPSECVECEAQMPEVMAERAALHPVHHWMRGLGN